MKVILLAGGLGSRLSELTDQVPKPLVKIGHRPIIVHLMHYYAHFGFDDFIICGGYKYQLIEQYFKDYNIRFKSIKVIDTGPNTQTGARIKLIEKYIDTDSFLLNYSDGLSNIPIDKVIKYHKSHNKLATLCAVKQQSRFGTLKVANDMVVQFKEKPDELINGGYYILRKRALDFIPHNVNTSVFEHEPLQTLAHRGELMAYKHSGFWKCMDSLKDKNELEEIWKKDAPWKV